MSEYVDETKLYNQTLLKNYNRLIDHRTKGFCLYIKFFYFNRRQSNLEFETKFAQIRYELTERHQFQNWQVDCNFQNFVNFRGIDFYNECALWGNICRTQVKMMTFGLFSNYKIHLAQDLLCPTSSAARECPTAFSSNLWECQSVLRC